MRNLQAVCRLHYEKPKAMVPRERKDDQVMTKKLTPADNTPSDPFEPTHMKRSMQTQLEDISSALGMILFTILFFGLFGLVALWRILYELQRG